MVASLSRAEGATEQLKAAEQMVWVGLINSICYRAEEIMRKDLIAVWEE